MTLSVDGKCKFARATKGNDARPAKSSFWALDRDPIYVCQSRPKQGSEKHVLLASTRRGKLEIKIIELQGELLVQSCERGCGVCRGVKEYDGPRWK